MNVSRIVLAVTLLMSFLPVAAYAGGAMIFKLGAMQLQDDSQFFGGLPRTLDSGSNMAYGILLEHRFQKSGIGVGVEYTFYRHAYTPPASPDGTAEARAIMISVRKYFLKEGIVHPFIGLGVGVGQTNVNHSTPIPFSDKEVTTPFQAVVGVEFRSDNLSFLIEAKHIHHDVNNSENQTNPEYDPSATGIFAGFGFNW
jgi:hypothetical protein